MELREEILEIPGRRNQRSYRVQMREVRAVRKLTEEGETGCYSKSLELPLWKLCVCELAVTVFAGVFCRLFAFVWQAAFVVLAFSFVYLLRIMMLREEYIAQKKIFFDVNSYMNQFSNALRLRRSIVPALEDVRISFKEGEFKDFLEGCISRINSSADIQAAKRRELLLIENTFANDDMKLLHDFAWKIESRGGSFDMELKLLGQVREANRKRMIKLQSALNSVLVFSVGLYIAMLFICVFIDRTMPKTVTIMKESMVQMAEVIAMAGVYFLVTLIERRQIKSWDVSSKHLSKKQAKKVFESYYKAFEPFKSFKRMRIRKILEFEFPRWLFDVCLLIQKNNVSVSIAESIHSSSAVMEIVLENFIHKLKKNPDDGQVYLDFLSEFELPGVGETMQMFLSIQKGAAQSPREQIDQLIDHNLNMLEEVEEQNFLYKNAMLSRYYFYPMLPTTALIIVYCVEIIVRIFNLIEGLI